MAGSSSSRKSMRSYRVMSSNLTITVGDDVIETVDRKQAMDSQNRKNPWRQVWKKCDCGWQMVLPARGHKRGAEGLSWHIRITFFLTIDGKCKVHTLNDYRKLERIGPDNYYCRLMYDPFNGSFNPKRVPLYCSCEKPYNPDLKMVQCEECLEWFHIRCIGMTDAEVEATPHFICADCRGGEASSRNPGVVESRQVQRTPAKRGRVTATGPVLDSVTLMKLNSKLKLCSL